MSLLIVAYLSYLLNTHTHPLCTTNLDISASGDTDYLDLQGWLLVIFTLWWWMLRGGAVCDCLLFVFLHFYYYIKKNSRVKCLSEMLHLNCSTRQSIYCNVFFCHFTLLLMVSNSLGEKNIMDWPSKKQILYLRCNMTALDTGKLIQLWWNFLFYFGNLHDMTGTW